MHSQLNQPTAALIYCNNPLNDSAQSTAMRCSIANALPYGALLAITDCLWPPYVIGQAIIVLPCCFFLSFFFSPNLSGCRLDVYHTSTHGLAPVRIYCRCEMCCTRLAGNTERKKSPFWHHRTTLSGYIFGTKACIDNRKKRVKHQYLLHMS